MFTHAIVRRVPSSFSDALSLTPPASAINVNLAQRQHAAYVDALRAGGLQVHVLPAIPEMPDSCFVEDCAVVGQRRVLQTRPGHPSRWLEPPAVGDVLRNCYDVHVMQEPATLDGGDCLRIEQTIYVGRSKRTNDAGIHMLRRVFEPDGFTIKVVEVHEALHLKSVCSYIGRGKLLLMPDTIPSRTFSDVDILFVPDANAVALRNRVLIAAGFPDTRRAVVMYGFEAVELDTSQFRLADGALTCLSVLYTRH